MQTPAHDMHREQCSRGAQASRLKAERMRCTCEVARAPGWADLCGGDPLCESGWCAAAACAWMIVCSSCNAW